MSRFGITIILFVSISALVGCSSLTSKSNQEASLFVAAEDANPDRLKRALASGVDVNCIADWGETPLMRAAEKGRLQQIELLCESGADIHAETSYGYTAAMLAAMGGHAEIVKYLLDKGNIDVNKEYGHNRKTLLDEAAFKSRPSPETVKLLIERGANVNHQGAGGYYPLWGTNLAITILLCEAGADVKLKNQSGETAFANAVMYDEFEKAKYLLEHGSDINNRDADGDTPIIYAASKGNIELIEFLIAHSGGPRI